MNRQTLVDKQEALTSTRRVPDITPTRIVEIELGQALSPLSAFDEKTDHHYQRALCLIRLHTRPLGMVELQLDENGLSTRQIVWHIWRRLHAQINEHLRQDGLPPIADLDPAGIHSPGISRCIEERERFLAHAPFVSVIVPTCCQNDRLSDCLRALLSLHYPQYEVIVVDNAPRTNATTQLMQQVYGDVPKVRYVREDRPGISWARNCGIKVARGEVLAFTDDDTVVDPYWLVELVQAFNVAGNVACTTGLILPLELETPAQFWFEEFGGFNKGFTRRIFNMKDFRPKTHLYPYTAGSFGTGASMAFTAAFLQSVNGFDPALGAGSMAKSGEDHAMFFQVITRGYTLVYEPGSLLYHLHRRDYRDLCKQIYNYGVGVIAYLLKSILDNPRLLLDLVTKLPYGLFFILSARSPKNRQKSTRYPKELTTNELKGMLYGPYAYVRSRRAKREVAKVFELVEEHIGLAVEKENQ